MDREIAMIRDKIRSIEDHPKEGIIFRDITPALGDSQTMEAMVKSLVELAKEYSVDKVVGIEARGFIVGAPVAYALGVGFVPIRKPGKLPAERYVQEYALEYGTDVIEMHKDAIAPGEKVLIVDDLLATGGTSVAAAKLIHQAGGEIQAFLFLIELDDLEGRKSIEEYRVASVLHY
ncbi:MAG: adenine phosphoribosyltransferase [Tissierellia bacterium]|nr:adenine phosphoribosyltransferase [Tissierellia bacterium]